MAKRKIFSPARFILLCGNLTHYKRLHPERASSQLNGETAYTTYSGGTTSERFVDYLRNILIPTLSPDSIVVMDNMRSHHTQAIKDLLEQAGVQYLYLPPYSPDLNPIEKMWSKLKAFLRKAKVRLLEKLPDAVRAAFKTISSHDCSGWFCFCGYSRQFIGLL